MKRKICLFTAHSPQTGGGGAILRSLLPNLPELDVIWCYIGPKAVAGYEDGYLGEAIMGGPVASDIKQTWCMLNYKSVTQLNSIVKKLINVQCDAYWIVSHNEGLRIAVDLVKQQNRPVHLTVHDDWAGALCARSVRYQFMKGPALRLTIDALKQATSVDVISEGMRLYYKRLSGVDADVCHRYLPETAINPAPYQPEDNDLIVAGHIGSIYDKKDFISFLKAFKTYAEQRGKTAMLKMWGCHLKVTDIPQQLQNNIQFFETLPESEALPALAQCAFVYAMYPFSRNLKTFSATSLPTKLTSYVQAGRPILGHGPQDSTLTAFLKNTGIGIVWDNLDTSNGVQQIAQVCQIPYQSSQWQAARDAYFGENNLSVMRKCLFLTK